MITILAYNPAFGAAYNLRQAFSLWEETRLITLADNQFLPGEDDIILTSETANYCRSLISESKFTMIADAAGLSRSLELLQPIKANWVAYWGDTQYWQNPGFYNDLAESLGIKVVFAMMDIMPKAPKKAIPLCHPVLDTGTSGKVDQLTIAHSPRTENKRHLKGTDKIEQVIARLYLDCPDLRYISILGLQWRDCLTVKSQAHIFIDQIPDKGMAAGLGRSGEEALAMGAVTVTALQGEEYLSGFFPPPPVVKVYDEKQLYNSLKQLVKLSDLMGTEGRAWAEQYLLFPGWLNYVGRFL